MLLIEKNIKKKILIRNIFSYSVLLKKRTKIEARNKIIKLKINN